MGSNFRYLFVAAIAGSWLVLGGADFSRDRQARAQDSGRSSRSEGESRDERRERYRRSYGDRGSDRGSEREHGGDRSERSRDGRGRSSDESRRDERSGSSASSNRSSSSSSSSSTPAASSSSTSTKSSSASSSSSMNMTDYAKSLVKQFDKNGDNMLQPEEQKDLHGRAASSDLNHDGVITIDELVANLSSNAPATASTTAAASPASGSSSSSAESGGHHHRDGDDPQKAGADASKRVLYGSAGGAAAGTKEGDKRHSYRFTPASERAAEQLPSRFKAMDKNGDGQVEMSEYSHSWSKSTAAEFERYDLDGDGVITAKEATPKSAGKGG